MYQLKDLNLTTLYICSVEFLYLKETQKNYEKE